MTILKVFVWVFLAYIGVVALLPGIVGYWQPDWDGGVAIATTDSDGQKRERIIASYRFKDELYVCSNFWFRGWYNHALENPEVEVVVDGKRALYTAVPVQGAEHRQLITQYTQGLVDDIFYGFAPRRFLRLETR